MTSPRAPQTIAFYRGKLPHWEVVDGLYFVTIHVRGAIPKAGQDRIRRMREQLALCSCESKATELQRQIFTTMEHWLETAPQNDFLSDPIAARIVSDAIAHRHERGDWRMIAHVTMPNHIHIFFKTDRRLKPLLTAFKRWTASEINSALNRGGARFWQQEWFDHWSRRQDEDDKIIRYIMNNPYKAGLVERGESWPWVGVYCSEEGI